MICHYFAPVRAVLGSVTFASRRCQHLSRPHPHGTRGMAFAVLHLTLGALREVRRCENMVEVNMVGVNMAFHDATCEFFEGTKLEPCLLKPCFHVAGL